MHKKKVLGLAIAVTLAVGIFVGQAVQADTNGTVPGSQEDPLVTKSYIYQLETKVNTLQVQVTSLQTNLSALQQKVAVLETKVAPPAVKLAATKTATLVATKGYFRAGPATTNKVLATLNKGTTMKVLGQSADWYKVQLANGQVGWIWSRVVSVK